MTAPEIAWRDGDRARDGFNSWKLGIAAAREKCIRGGQILPDPSKPNEVRQQREGPVKSSDLDTVKNG